jgi:hypothetical protein
MFHASPGISPWVLKHANRRYSIKNRGKKASQRSPRKELFMVPLGPTGFCLDRGEPISHFVFEGDLELEGKPQTVSMVICGGALFAGGIGATDHPQGNLALLLDNIRSRIFTLPEETLVLPGHGPVTTVGNEKRNNPFFRG